MIVETCLVWVLLSGELIVTRYDNTNTSEKMDVFFKGMETAGAECLGEL